jgi:hypothetical protein
MTTTKLIFQPLLAGPFEADPDHKEALDLNQFLTLLKEEEDYFEGEQHTTNLMITRLRKIFYDQWGWNSELIRARAHIEGRYVVTVVNDPVSLNIPKAHAVEIRRYKKNEYQPKHRVITYRPDDRIYGATRVGQVPEIYKNNHQEVLLPEGYYCDMAHILAGLDAANYSQVVSPLPSFLSFLNSLVPHVDSNVDIVTWLGDIASSSGDFLFAYLKADKRPLSPDQEQTYINQDAPGADMLGDIDSYVIKHHYDVSTRQGKRITEILSDYYNADTPGVAFRQRRFSTFCQIIGLNGWNGENFANEKQWLAYYGKELRNNVSFQAFSITHEDLKSLWLCLRIWLGGYKDTLKMHLLLVIFLNALKENIKLEPNSK